MQKLQQKKSEIKKTVRAESIFISSRVRTFVKGFFFAILYKVWSLWYHQELTFKDLLLTQFKHRDESLGKSYSKL